MGAIDWSRDTIDCDDGGANVVAMETGHRNGLIQFGIGNGWGQGWTMAALTHGFADVTATGAGRSGLTCGVTALSYPQFLSLVKNFCKGYAID